MPIVPSPTVVGKNVQSALNASMPFISKLVYINVRVAVFQWSYVFYSVIFIEGTSIVRDIERCLEGFMIPSNNRSFL